MRERNHIKFIASDNGGPRYEHVIKSHEGVAAAKGFQVFSALYGDGKGRYTDVTKTVQQWGQNWPENWEEVLYAERKPRVVGISDIDMDSAGGDSRTGSGSNHASDQSVSLKIHAAAYGLGHGDVADMGIDVTQRLQSLVKDGSLDIVVNNSTLTPNQNPYRGKRKYLTVFYSIDGGPEECRSIPEKDWLIIGPRIRDQITPLATDIALSAEEIKACYDAAVESGSVPVTAPALNDYLIRKFQISDRRLRGPMPIELRDFHRNDLAELFAELGFKRGAEIGVAEGHYSEILLKANPDLELLLVDPWRRYDGNPYAHSQEHQDFSLNETKRKTAPYPNVRIMQDFSMNAVREVEEGSLDMVYIDAHHGFDWVMSDLIEWGKRVRSGGIISGDDYYHFKRSWAGVVEAVNAYTQAHRVSPWFLIDAPRSVDFFWCKP